MFAGPLTARRRIPDLEALVKRYLIPIAAGFVVFGVATAFAASLTLTGTSLGAGTASTASCNASASVTFNSSYASAIPGYKVTTAPVTTAVACASKAYKVTLSGAANASLGEITGTLDASGNASPDFSASNIAASLVTGISVVITG
jgi:hypothetical protein